jgi:hypothetical protein
MGACQQADAFWLKASSLFTISPLTLPTSGLLRRLPPFNIFSYRSNCPGGGASRTRSASFTPRQDQNTINDPRVFLPLSGCLFLPTGHLL